MKTLLLSLEYLERIDDLLLVASQIAAAHDSHVIGLYVIPGPIMLSPDYGMAMPPIDGQFQTQYAEKAPTVRSRFEDQMRRDGISFEWREVRAMTSKTLPTIIAQSREADLVILGHDAPDRDGEIFDVAHAGDLILGSGRPVLIVPPLKGKSFDINKAVIGWKDSREASRAAFDSVRLLKSADEVHLVSVNSKVDMANVETVPQFDIAEALARHGLKIETHVINNQPKPGSALLSHAKEHQADLLVIGAYGRSRLRERLLGGVTEYILRHTSIPVLLSN